MPDPRIGKEHVARDLGVSPTRVSQALRGDFRVSPARRSALLEEAVRPE